MESPPLVGMDGKFDQAMEGGKKIVSNSTTTAKTAGNHILVIWTQIN